MKSSNRLLLTFGIIIGVLAIVAVTLVMTMAPEESALLPENTPEGVVQRFLLAVKDGDYAKAYSYLSLEENGKKVSYEEWKKRFSLHSSSDRPGWKATMGKSRIAGNEATVEVTIETFRPGGPFENPVNTNYTSFSLKRVGDSWFITSPPGLYWIY